MEKRKAHYPLDRVKELARQNNVRVTKTASTNSAHLGFDFEAIKETVILLEPGDLYKSMTAYANATVWHDVYRFPSVVGVIYLKLQIIDDLLIISFKEL